MKYGYVRPFDLHETNGQQMAKMSGADHIIVENHAHNKRRTELKRLIDEEVTPGDTIIVTDLCILADSTKHLLDIIRHRSEEHTSELQSRGHLVCRLLLD